MTKVTIIIAAVASACIALLVHTQYIRYAAATKGHLYVISRADEISSKQVKDKMKQTLIDASSEAILIMNNEEPVHAGCGLTKDGKPPQDPLDFKSYTPCWAVDRQRANELREKMLATIDRQPVYFGMLPSSEIGGPPRLQRRDAFWVGIILPLSLVFLAIILLFLAPTRKSR